MPDHEVARAARRRYKTFARAKARCHWILRQQPIQKSSASKPKLDPEFRCVKPERACTLA